MNPAVILLHGLRHTRWSMRKMEGALTDAGRRVFNLGYPSGQAPVDDLAKLIWTTAVDRFGDERVFDFVTHSLGSIILRQIAIDHPGVVRRAVMLAPPNNGSELVDAFQRFALARWIMGPAGQQLGVTDNSLPQRLGPVDFCLGIIAGIKPDNPISRYFIPGDEDGRVSLESTKVDGYRELKIVPYGHFYLMRVDEVIRQTVHFLENGSFSPG